MSDTDFCPHGFPKNTDNTCIFCERDQLRQRAEAAEDERDKLKIQFGSCSICGYVAWKEQVVNSQTVEVCQYCDLKAKVQSLVEILKCTCIPHNVNWQSETCYPECYACRIKTWLQQWDNSKNHK